MSVIYNGRKYKVRRNRKGLLTLDLSNRGINEISEIKGLKNLTELQALNLNSNRITRIKGLETLTKLQHLRLRNNSISEIEGLDALRNLLTLDLSSNRITRIKGLEALKDLKYLDLFSNSISEISGLEDLMNLERLDLDHNEIFEIKGLDNLEKLQELNLRFNKISHVVSLRNIDNIPNISFLGNPIDYPLSFLPGNLKSERLNKYTQISNQEIQEIVEKGKADQGIVSYNGSEYHTIMKNGKLTLDLSNKGIKKISEIKGLENLTGLQTLNLSYNPITTLEGLDNLGLLEDLNLYGCEIRQIESFKNKRNLKYFNIGNNPIYKHIKTAILGKKKLSWMTEAKRGLMGVDPTIWQIAVDFQGKFLSRPPSGSRDKSRDKISRRGAGILGAFGLVGVLLIFTGIISSIYGLTSTGITLIIIGVIIEIIVFSILTNGKCFCFAGDCCASC